MGHRRQRLRGQCGPVSGLREIPDEAPDSFGGRLEALGSLIEPQANGCWLWTGRVNDAGYGVTPNGLLVHRVVYEILVGPIPDGHDLHHECETPPCCNPSCCEPMIHGDHVAHHAAQRRAASA